MCNNCCCCKAPTAEEVAEAVNGDVETAKRALDAIKFEDETDEE